MSDSIVKTKVVVSEFLGAESMLYCTAGKSKFTAQVDARDYHNPGENVEVAFEMSKAHFFDSETKDVIR